ncbi:MAG: 4Fe-4S dicluster domain-containing protein [Chloroflexi bacterium]|nr:4Fe-4S dicluster domain-containing protein [Chloroflexota bacterium]
MSLKIINKEDVLPFVASAMKEYEVLGPVANDTAFKFSPFADASQLRLDYNTTMIPPKKALLPQEETLFTFRTDMLSATPVFDMQWRVLFGVHTCDLHAMCLLDAVFAKGNPDSHYMKRRATTLIVSIECLDSCDDNSFCKNMNTLSASSGFDLHLIDLGGIYAVDVGTTAGEILLTNHAKAHNATRQEVALLDKTMSAKWAHFPSRLHIDGKDLPSLMGISYKSPVWEEIGARCFGCGGCNIVCPTCYCFDVIDRASMDGKTGERYRVWDSCQLDDFARIGSGENFRKTHAQRLRHRFMRKGKYIAEAYPGHTGCVGCGRCARQCLVDITPISVWNSLQKAYAM